MNRPAAVLRAFWCRIPSRPNFGDALTPWLIHRITGLYPRFTAPNDVRHKYMVTGSIIVLAGQACTVWGAGIMNADDRVSAQARVLAVRGPLTWKRALACGVACPPVFGDPALLLPRLYRPPVGLRRGLGLIAHFSDRPALDLRRLPTAGVRVIDIQSGIEEVVSQICACEWVVSSSLHGLIASHAYGVPAVWIKFHDLPSGDDSKFHDYYASLGVDPPAPIRASYRDLDLKVLAPRAWCPDHLDTEAMWQACPFFGGGGGSGG